MRRELAALRRAGIQRTRFSAFFSGISPRGHVILSDLKGPFGNTPYVWIPFEQWKSRLLLPGSEVEFLASVCPYWRDGDRSQDFGLCDISELEVLP